MVNLTASVIVRNEAERMPERFWSKVDQRGLDECWNWTASTCRGYGQFMIKARSHSPQKAHRIAWELANGEQPPSDRLVCHTCDNRLCCNPAHLFVGTHADNSRDASAKGRIPHGDAHWMRAGGIGKPWGGRRQVYGATRLSEETVRRVRELRSDGLSFGEIARRTGMSRTNAWRIATAQTRVSVR